MQLHPNLNNKITISIRERRAPYSNENEVTVSESFGVLTVHKSKGATYENVSFYIDTKEIFGMEHVIRWV